MGGTLQCSVSSSGRHDFTGNRCVLCGEDLSGTPVGRPGVLEDGGSAAGEPTPPAPGAPEADPPSPTFEEMLADPDEQFDRRRAEVLARLQASIDAFSKAKPLAAPGPTPALPSLTAEMQVARCRVLLDQWRKDRQVYDYPRGNPAADATFLAMEFCENELREALGET